MDVFPEFAPPRVEIQTITLGLSARRSRSSSPSRSSSAQRRARASTRSARSRSRSSRRSSSSSSAGPTSCRRGSSCRSGSARDADAADLGGAAGDDPAAVVDEPGHEDRALLETADSLIDMSMIAYWKIRARLLRVPGVANVPIWGERLHQMTRSRSTRAAASHNVSLTRSWRPTATRPRRRAPRSSRGSVIGTGGFIDTPNQRLNVRHVAPDRHPDDLAPCRSSARRRDRSSSATWPTSWSTTSRSSATPSSTTAGPDAHRREASRGRTRSRSRAASRRRSTRCGPASRASRSTPRSSGRRPSSRRRSTTSRGAPDRRAARGPRARRVPVRVAHGADQRRLDPALAGRRGARALPGAARRST